MLARNHETTETGIESTLKDFSGAVKNFFPAAGLFANFPLLEALQNADGHAAMFHGALAFDPAIAETSQHCLFKYWRMGKRCPLVDLNPQVSHATP